MEGWVLIFRSATPILLLRFCDAAPSPYLQAMTAPDRTVAFRIDKPAPDRAEAATLMALGKIAMSRILHETAAVETEIIGAEALLAGSENPEADDINFLTLNAFFTSIGGGTDQIQRNIIGERVLGLAKEPEVDRDILADLLQDDEEEQGRIQSYNWDSAPQDDALPKDAR